MMDLLRRQLVAQFQPDAVQEIDFLRRQVRRMRAQIEDMLLAGREIDARGSIAVSDRAGAPRPDPRCALLRRPAMFGDAPRTTVDACRLCAARKIASHLSVAAATARWMRFPFLLGELQRAREQLLLFQTEQLLRRQLVFAAARALQESQMQHDDVLLVGVDAVEHGARDCIACCSSEPAPARCPAARQALPA